MRAPSGTVSEGDVLLSEIRHEPFHPLKAGSRCGAKQGATITPPCVTYAALS
jgi:hypothetical protein